MNERNIDPSSDKHGNETKTEYLETNRSLLTSREPASKLEGGLLKLKETEQPDYEKQLRKIEQELRNSDYFNKEEQMKKEWAQKIVIKAVGAFLSKELILNYSKRSTPINFEERKKYFLGGKFENLNYSQFRIFSLIFTLFLGMINIFFRLLVSGYENPENLEFLREGLMTSFCGFGMVHTVLCLVEFLATFDMKGEFIPKLFKKNNGANQNHGGNRGSNEGEKYQEIKDFLLTGYPEPPSEERDSLPVFHNIEIVTLFLDFLKFFLLAFTYSFKLKVFIFTQVLTIFQKILVYVACVKESKSSFSNLLNILFDLSLLIVGSNAAYDNKDMAIGIVYGTYFILGFALLCFCLIVFKGFFVKEMIHYFFIGESLLLATTAICLHNLLDDESSIIVRKRNFIILLFLSLIQIGGLSAFFILVFRLNDAKGVKTTKAESKKSSKYTIISRSSNRKRLTEGRKKKEKAGILGRKGKNSKNSNEVSDSQKDIKINVQIMKQNGIPDDEENKPEEKIEPNYNFEDIKNQLRRELGDSSKASDIKRPNNTIEKPKDVVEEPKEIETFKKVDSPEPSVSSEKNSAPPSKQSNDIKKPQLNEEDFDDFENSKIQQSEQQSEEVLSDVPSERSSKKIEMVKKTNIEDKLAVIKEKVIPRKISLSKRPLNPLQKRLNLNRRASSSPKQNSRRVKKDLMGNISEGRIYINKTRIANRKYLAVENYSKGVKNVLRKTPFKNKGIREKENGF